MVVARIRDSANARSSGTRGLRWWQTISMSRCSATVFTVCGSVGLVEPGITCGWRGDLDDVRRVPTAGTLGVEGVDGAAADRRQRRLEVAGLVEAVGVQRDLEPELVRGPQRSVDRGRRGAPVLVHLVRRRRRPAPAPPGPPRETVLPLPISSTLTRQRVERPVDGPQVPGARGHRGRLRPLGGAGAAAADRGDAGGQRLDDLGARQQVHVHVDRAGGQDLALAGDHVGRRGRSPGRGGRRRRCRGCPRARARRSGRRACPRRRARPPSGRARPRCDDRVQRASGPGHAPTGPSTRGSTCHRRRRPPRRRRCRSSSTSIHRSVSPRRTWSPVVGP